MAQLVFMCFAAQYFSCDTLRRIHSRSLLWLQRLHSRIAGSGASINSHVDAVSAVGFCSLSRVDTCHREGRHLSVTVSSAYRPDCK
jgi:hypothetical protein